MAGVVQISAVYTEEQIRLFLDILKDVDQAFGGFTAKEH